MIDPLPDARLRDDVAQQLFTQVMGRLEGLKLGRGDGAWRCQNAKCT